VESHVKNIENIAAEDHGPASNRKQRSTLLHSFRVLRIKVEHIRYFFKVFKSFDNSLIPNIVGIISQVRTFEAQLPHLSYVQSTSSSINQAFHGFAMKIEGKICIGRICFEKMNISLKRDQSQSDILTIRGTATRYLDLGSVIFLPKGGEVILNKSNQVFFRPTVDIFGIRKVVSAEIIENTLSFNTSGLILGRHQAWINVTAKTNVAEWSSLKFNVTGKLNKNTSLIKELQTKINSRILDLAEKATKRVKSAENIADDSKRRLNAIKTIKKERIKTVSELQKQKKRAAISLRLARAKYRNFTLSHGRSLVAKTTKGNRKNGISRRSAKSDNFPCKLLECPKKSYRGKKSCYPEQKRIMVPRLSTDCHNSRKTVFIKTFKSVAKKEYFFLPTFKLKVSGNCGKRFKPSITWAAIGAGGGAGVGIGILTVAAGPLSAIPLAIVAGAVGGMHVGGVIGGLKEYFNGCNIGIKTIRGPDIKISFLSFSVKMVSKRKEVTKTVCKRIKRMMPFGSVLIQKCSYPPINMADPTCLKSNEECLEKLRLHPDTKQEWSKLKDKNLLSNKMETARMKDEQINFNLDKARQELKMTEAQLSQLRYATDRSVSAMNEIKNLESTKMGLRISQMLNRNRPQEIASISDITFNSANTKPTKNMPMSMNLHSNRVSSKPFHFLGNFDDKATFTKVLSRSLDSLLDIMGANRKKRSVNIKNNRSNYNSSDSQPSLTKEKPCLMARNGNLFFKDIIIYLQRSISMQDMIQKSDKVSKELYYMYQNILDIKSTSTNKSSLGITSIETSLDEMLNAYLDLINSLLNDTKSASLWTFEDILNNWKSFLEVLTKEKSFSYCAGALDCVVETVDKLQELYFYEEDLPRAREIHSLLPNITDGITYLMTQNVTMKEATK
jgi:hypothetical protein